MKAVLKGCCKSEWNAYYALALSECVPGGDLEVSVLAPGKNILPCEWRLADEDKTAGTVGVVVRSAYVHAGKTTIEVRDKRNGDKRDVACISVDANRLIWESRINYRLRRKLAQRIRTIGDANSDGCIELRFDAAFDDGDRIALYGTALMGYCDAPMAFECLDENGGPSDVQPVVLTDAPCLLQEGDCAKGRRVDFSMRIPANQRVFTLIASDTSGKNERAFCTLPKAMLDRLRNSTFERTGDASGDDSYNSWFDNRRIDPVQLECQTKLSEDMGVRFSVVVPVDDADPESLEKTVNSLRGQSMRAWKVILQDLQQDGVSVENVQAMVEADGSATSQLDDDAGLVDSYVVIVEPGMVLEPNALFEFAKAIKAHPGADALYCDEDLMTAEGQLEKPFFKPDFSIFMLRSFNYIGRMICIRANLLESAWPEIVSPNDGARAYRLALRIAESASDIVHVAHVLAHEADGSVDTDGPVSLRDQALCQVEDFESAIAVRDHLERLRIQAEVSPGAWRGVQNVRYFVHDRPLVSVIIPNKDSSAMLADCVQSILEKTDYPHYEVIVVENNSVEEATFAYYDRIQKADGRVRVVKWEEEFNFSKIINFGVQHASGDYYLLLNNDTKVIAPAWMSAMLGVCQQPGVGAVGARLLYADGSIQHAGALITDMFSGAHHAFMGLPGSHPGYYLQAAIARDCSIVTGACMLTSRDAFEGVGGFAEELVVAYNDVDYCLKLREKGFGVVYEPAAELYHFESVSRGYDAFDQAKRIRLYSEEALMHAKWAEIYVLGDPFFNPNLESFYYRLKKT